METLTAWSTLGAAIATAASVIFIAWQIRLTRKSVEATEDTLKIARDEFKHGQILRADAQRTSIDAEMPRLTVEVTRQSTQVWRTDVTETDRYSRKETAAEVKAGDEFTTPRDNNTPLQVGVEISISNDGPRRARVRIDTQDRSHEVVINAGGTHTEWAKRVQPLSEWIEIARVRQQGEPGEERNMASIVYIYPGDVGAIEVHNVIQGGTFVEPVADNAGAWRIKSFERTPAEPNESLNAVAMPFTRTYWASRIENRPL
ncbi:hypothetical protein OH146_00145 [Salinibacterium sp. SYSU T00001]|uniref:hypothetical protein n=1 Tax=Homoserinimonas sedimenticola TaxID=2986805 RepID=UPI002235C1B8|nr:hypothetical protein [Salinibacterium sedimenticola]MCW4384180.1 hypothetical protein [Salinibacterium sedimenticola]